MNGYRVGNEFWEGKNITYKCNKGYWLRGPFVRVCNEIGNWTEDEPTCEGTKTYKYSEQWFANSVVLTDEGWKYKVYKYKDQSFSLISREVVQILSTHLLLSLPFLFNMGYSYQPPGPDFEPSEILHNQTEYWELLKGWLGRVSTLPSKWKLCYRATDNGWSSSTFHSQCNGLGPTVTFIRVGEYIFGGYTDRDWRKYNFSIAWPRKKVAVMAG